MSLPIFYKPATISLKHEDHLHLLRGKIGGDNMARLRSVAVGGYTCRLSRSETLAMHTPPIIDKLYIEWDGVMPGFFDSTPKSYPKDGSMRRVLDSAFR
jgi:hypothetical protein